MVKYPQEFKEQAVIDLCSREQSAQSVAEEHGVSREILYTWKRQLLKEGQALQMPKKNKELGISQNSQTSPQTDELLMEKEALLKQVDTLQKQIYRLQLERDVLEKAAEIVKKEEGISPRTLTNREKAIVINALREKYLLKDLLSILNMAKSSYCYHALVLKKDEKYALLRDIIKQVFHDSFNRYGYRRVHSVI